MTQVIAQKPASLPTSAVDAFKYLGILIVIITGVALLSIGFLFVDKSNQPVQISYFLVFLIGLVSVIFGIIALLRERIKFKINVGYFTIFTAAAFLASIFLLPRNTIESQNLQTWVGIGFSGILFLFIALRPNFGPEANKRIYQAVAGIFAFTVAIFILILGLYIVGYEPQPGIRYGLDIRLFMGKGTFPGDVEFTYINRMVNGAETYEKILSSGQYLIIGALIIMGLTFVRNKLGLMFSALGLFVAIFVVWIGLGLFFASWNTMDDLFYQYYPLEYSAELQLSDPGIFSIGLVLVLLEYIAMTLLFYASVAAKPIEKWRATRDRSIAAAEVATREGNLATAMKYLEAAAMWSSKIDEEDKSIELLTRVKQIKDKAIKLKKQEAAEKAKKDYDKRQKAEMKEKVKEKPSPPAKEEKKKDDKTPKKVD